MICRSATSCRAARGNCRTATRAVSQQKEMRQKRGSVLKRALPCCLAQGPALNPCQLVAAARTSLGMSPFDPRQPLRTSLCETVLYCRSRACPPKVNLRTPFCLLVRKTPLRFICCTGRDTSAKRSRGERGAGQGRSGRHKPRCDVARRANLRDESLALVALRASECALAVDLRMMKLQ